MVDFYFRLRKRTIKENIRAFGFWRGIKRKSEDVLSGGEFITNGTINIILPVFKEMFKDYYRYKGKELENILIREISMVITHEYLHYVLYNHTYAPLNKHHFIINKMIRDKELF